jgi:hypothetical protein
VVINDDDDDDDDDDNDDNNNNSIPFINILFFYKILLIFNALDPTIYMLADSVMKMEPKSFDETLAFVYKTTWCQNSEDHNLSYRKF